MDGMILQSRPEYSEWTLDPRDHAILFTAVCRSGGPVVSRLDGPCVDGVLFAAPISLDPPRPLRECLRPASPVRGQSHATCIGAASSHASDCMPRFLDRTLMRHPCIEL